MTRLKIENFCDKMIEQITNEPAVKPYVDEIFVASLEESLYEWLNESDFLLEATMPGADEEGIKEEIKDEIARITNYLIKQKNERIIS